MKDHSEALEHASVRQYCKAVRVPTVGANFVSLAEQAVKEIRIFGASLCNNGLSLLDVSLDPRALPDRKIHASGQSEGAMRLCRVRPDNPVIGLDGYARQIFASGRFQCRFPGVESGLRGHDVRATGFGSRERIL